MIETVNHNFEQNGYLIIKNILSKDNCELLCNYTRLKAQIKPKVHKGNDPLANIHREYGDPMMETLLQKFTPSIEQATGLELWPTLSFYYHYSHGNILNPHKDRDSCEIVAGLCIGADDQYKKNEGSWPLVLKINNQPVSVKLDYGDLVIFKGHSTEHWREQFTGEWFVSAIFAYVDKHGKNAYQKYDQRKAIGKPHVGMTKWLLGRLLANLRSYSAKA